MTDGSPSTCTCSPSGVEERGVPVSQRKGAMEGARVFHDPHMQSCCLVAHAACAARHLAESSTCERARPSSWLHAAGAPTSSRRGSLTTGIDCSRVRPTSRSGSLLRSRFSSLEARIRNSTSTCRLWGNGCQTFWRGFYLARRTPHVDRPGAASLSDLGFVLLFSTWGRQGLVVVCLTIPAPVDL